MNELSSRGVRCSWSLGGASLAPSFRSGAQITEYIVSVMSVILGHGHPMLGNSSDKDRLELIIYTVYEQDVIQLDNKSVPHDA